MKKFFSRLNRSAGNKTANVKTKLSTAKKKFQENLAEAKSQPRSKRKSLFFGFSTVLSIFGIVLLAPLLPAIAKDLPNNGGGGTVCPQPAPPAPAPSKKMLEALSGIAAAVCGAAVTSGSFVIGAACGFWYFKSARKINGYSCSFF